MTLRYTMEKIDPVTKCNMLFFFLQYSFIITRTRAKDRNTFHEASRVFMSEFVHFNEGNLAEQNTLSFTHYDE